MADKYDYLEIEFTLENVPELNIYPLDQIYDKTNRYMVKFNELYQAGYIKMFNVTNNVDFTFRVEVDDKDTGIQEQRRTDSIHLLERNTDQEILEYMSENLYRVIYGLMRTYFKVLECPIQLLDIVVVSFDHTPLDTNYEVKKGQRGTVVEILRPGRFEVEFTNDNGRTIAVIPMRIGTIEKWWCKS